MLKSIDFIRKLELDLNENINLENIVDFYIELRITQKIDVYIVSDKINQISDLFLKTFKLKRLKTKI